MALTTMQTLGDGARLLGRRKAVVAWIFLGYLLLGGAAGLVAHFAVGPVLNRSLYSDRLASGFDLTVLFELLTRPEVSLMPAVAASLILGLLLGAALLFCTPGVCAEFLADQPLGYERFFQACGGFLWRFVRLVVLTSVILLPTMGLLGGVRSALMRAAGYSSHLRLPFMVFVGASLVAQLVGLVLRAWFDTAEFELVAGNRDSARRALGAARRLTGGFRLQLLGLYLVPSVLMCLATAALLWLWVMLPAQRVGLAILTGQSIILCWVVARLWQRASQAAWYQAHQPVPVEPSPFPLETAGEMPPPDALPVEADLP